MNLFWIRIDLPPLRRISKIVSGAYQSSQCCFYDRVQLEFPWCSSFFTAFGAKHELFRKCHQLFLPERCRLSLRLDVIFVILLPKTTFMLKLCTNSLPSADGFECQQQMKSWLVFVIVPKNLAAGNFFRASSCSGESLLVTSQSALGQLARQQADGFKSQSIFRLQVTTWENLSASGHYFALSSLLCETIFTKRKSHQKLSFPDAEKFLDDVRFFQHVPNHDTWRIFFEDLKLFRCCSFQVVIRLNDTLIRAIQDRALIPNPVRQRFGYLDFGIFIHLNICIFKYFGYLDIVGYLDIHIHEYLDIWIRHQPWWCHVLFPRSNPNTICLEFRKRRFLASAGICDVLHCKRAKDKVFDQSYLGRAARISFRKSVFAMFPLELVLVQPNLWWPEVVDERHSWNVKQFPSSCWSLVTLAL